MAAVTVAVRVAHLEVHREKLGLETTGGELLAALLAALSPAAWAELRRTSRGIDDDFDLDEYRQCFQLWRGEEAVADDEELASLAEPGRVLELQLAPRPAYRKVADEEREKNDASVLSVSPVIMPETSSAHVSKRVEKTVVIRMDLLEPVRDVLWNPWDDTSFIGSGEFASVYEGRLVGKQQGIVAVKVFERREKMIKEAENLSLIEDFGHIVRPRGYFDVKEGGILLRFDKEICAGQLDFRGRTIQVHVSGKFAFLDGSDLSLAERKELCESLHADRYMPMQKCGIAFDRMGCNLGEWLDHNASRVRDSDVVRICIDITSGMEAYAGSKRAQKNSHGDLKLDNVLLEEKDQLDAAALVCDFGEATSSSKGPRGGGTVSYMAPEILGDEMSNSVVSDVWSFGIIIWELIATFVARKTMRAAQAYAERGLNDKDSLRKGLKTGFPLAVKGTSQRMQSLRFLMLQCLQTDPAMRQNSWSTVLAALKSISVISDEDDDGDESGDTSSEDLILAPLLSKRLITRPSSPAERKKSRALVTTGCDSSTIVSESVLEQVRRLALQRKEEEFRQLHSVLSTCQDTMLIMRVMQKGVSSLDGLLLMDLNSGEWGASDQAKLQNACQQAVHFLSHNPHTLVPFSMDSANAGGQLESSVESAAEKSDPVILRVVADETQEFEPGQVVALCLDSTRGLIACQETADNALSYAVVVSERTWAAVAKDDILFAPIDSDDQEPEYTVLIMYSGRVSARIGTLVKDEVVLVGKTRAHMLGVTLDATDPSTGMTRTMCWMSARDGELFQLEALQNLLSEAGFSRLD